MKPTKIEAHPHFRVVTEETYAKRKACRELWDRIETDRRLRIRCLICVDWSLEVWLPWEFHSQRCYTIAQYEAWLVKLDAWEAENRAEPVPSIEEVGKKEQQTLLF